MRSFPVPVVAGKSVARCMGKGKRGGARVIYFVIENDAIWLLIAYTKAKFDNLPTSFLAELKNEVENAL